jgi:hypothetical protein
MKDGRSWLSRLCRLQPEGKKDLVLIAEVHQRAKRQTLRRGELQRPRRHSYGERPVNMRRFARIAGILPIDMPARLELEVEAAVISGARIELSLAEYKLYMHMRRVGGTRRRPHGRSHA